MTARIEAQQGEDSGLLTRRWSTIDLARVVVSRVSPATSSYPETTHDQDRAFRDIDAHACWPAAAQVDPVARAIAIQALSIAVAPTTIKTTIVGGEQPNTPAVSGRGWAEMAGKLLVASSASDLAGWAIRLLFSTSDEADAARSRFWLVLHPLQRIPKLLRRRKLRHRRERACATASHFHAYVYAPAREGAHVRHQFL